LAVLELGPPAYGLLDRKALYSFFGKMKKGGRFTMHQEGECDLRASFIVTLITKSLKLPEDLLEGVAEVIIESQTHEGGISNVIGGEAHGGFTFCGVAALALLGRLQDLDVSLLVEWMSQRQVQFGGFNGRTNKLIDSCYSFWIGAVFNILNDYFKGKMSVNDHLLYSERNLQEYILLYCQDLKRGGLWDKPGKGRDIYHTCYAVSGLALSQELCGVMNDATLEPVDPIYNVSRKALNEAEEWFKGLSPW
jgi:protein farnesyltransferase subunit beta